MDMVDGSSQTEWQKPCNAAVQYTPRSVTEDEAQAVWRDDAMKEFFSRVAPR